MIKVSTPKALITSGCARSIVAETARTIAIVTIKAKKFFEPKIPMKANDRETPSYLYSPNARDSESDTSVESMSADRNERGDRLRAAITEHAAVAKY
jgi:hypothetical protein